MTTEPSIRFLDAVHIDDQRQYIEFRFQGTGGEQETVQIDFAYVESLAAIFQQAFISAALDTQQGSNQGLGDEFLAVPRADIDHPVKVGVDIMTNRIVAMFLLGSPFQVSYALPAASARRFADDLLSACNTAVQQEATAARRRTN